jgi:hypothetical protein
MLDQPGRLAQQEGTFMPGRKPEPVSSEQLSAYFARIGRKGGKARLQTMTAAERKAAAKKAVAAREARKRKDNR